MWSVKIKQRGNVTNKQLWTKKKFVSTKVVHLDSTQPEGPEGPEGGPEGGAMAEGDRGMESVELGKISKRLIS